MIKKIQEFLQELQQVSLRVEKEVVSDFDNFAFREEIKPDKDEVSIFAQLLLMNQIREHCSQEFLKIIDKVISSEIDMLDDFIFENQEANNSIRSSLMSLTKNVDWIKMDLLSQIKHTFLANLGNNHEIF